MNWHIRSAGLNAVAPDAVTFGKRCTCRTSSAAAAATNLDSQSLRTKGDCADAAAGVSAAAAGAAAGDGNSRGAGAAADAGDASGDTFACAAGVSTAVAAEDDPAEGSGAEGRDVGCQGMSPKPAIATVAVVPASSPATT